MRHGPGRLPIFRDADGDGDAAGAASAIDAAYMDWAMPIIQRRITQAGVRLAHLLNLALDPAYRR